MARPAKVGLDYFPLDCVLDDKIELIEAEFGLIGFAVVVKLLQKIYGEQGYYCEWTKEVALLFARKCGVGGNAVSEIVTSSLKRGIFNNDLFNKYGILTSRGIQKRYFEAVSRRKQIEVKSEYLLIEVAQFSKNASNNSDNVDINLINDIKSTQSKVKESKVKERKVEETASPDGSASTPSPSLDQIIYDYGKENTDKYVQKVRKWYAGKGKPISDLEVTVRKWLEQDGVEKIDHSIDKYNCIINKF